MSGGNCWTANHHQPVIFSSHTFLLHSCFISILGCTIHFRFARNTFVGRHQKTRSTVPVCFINHQVKPHMSQCCWKKGGFYNIILCTRNLESFGLVISDSVKISSKSCFVSKDCMWKCKCKHKEQRQRKDRLVRTFFSLLVSSATTGKGQYGGSWLQTSSG